MDGVAQETEAVPRLRAIALSSAHGGPYSLDLASGECVCVVGRSGSGKSVLLRLIADMDPHNGEVALDGRLCTSWPAPQWRHQVVYQAAEPAWWASTAVEHFPALDTSAWELLMAPLGLDTALLNADITRLSTGERQRLALVRSLALRPRVLLLDEPTASLDTDSTMAVESVILQRMRDGLSVILVTHSREQALRMGHRLMEVRDRTLYSA